MHDGLEAYPTMRIIPVIDLLGGRVVRAIAGRRSEYRPLVSPLCPTSDPAQLAITLSERHHYDELYVADLDAIGGQAFDRKSLRTLTEIGPRLWCDIGLRSAEQAREAIDFAPDARWILALETIPSAAVLRECIATFTPHRCAFSLDLHDGRPRAANASWQGSSPEQIAAEVVSLGISRLIVLDLADVGTAGGTRTLDLCRRLRKTHPEIELIAGGGVRDAADLQRLEDAGCNAALVATALHAGKLGLREP